MAIAVIRVHNCMSCPYHLFSATRCGLSPEIVSVSCTRVRDHGVDRTVAEVECEEGPRSSASINELRRLSAVPEWCPYVETEEGGHE